MNTYTATHRTLVHSLTALKTILEKGEAFVKEGTISEEAMLNDALAHDMFPFKRQIQLASDHAKGCVARLTGKDNPSMADTEETFQQLGERLDKTLAFLATVTEADFAGADERKIEIRWYPGKYITGADYALQYAMPNFFFHLTTAYALLRKNGVQLGKTDFLGNLSLVDL